ncbi:MAG: hypothetical protein A3I44_03285 [Candidatus Sungbacteria bacterium RIFCSPLOWO2_02_FULL_51_17]|nr:MAG: hypothetical protein A3I44_03285 [Candidatus Sungbacteria bacterium RIFCSPLOWO2_02_FULL_51_17]
MGHGQNILYIFRALQNFQIFHLLRLQRTEARLKINKILGHIVCRLRFVLHFRGDFFNLIRRLAKPCRRHADRNRARLHPGAHLPHARITRKSPEAHG